MRHCVHLRRTDFLRIAALAVLVMNAGACSMMPDVPDWVDPTTWFGSDEPADNGQTPDLAGLPNQPQATQPDDQQEISESLSADRANAKHSADALRGGTEVAASPPPDIAVAQAGEDETVKPAAATPAPAATPAAGSPVRVARYDRSIAQDPSGRVMAGTLPETPPATVVATVDMPAAAAPPPAASAPQTPAPAPAAQPGAAPVQAAQAPAPSRPRKPVQSAPAVQPAPAPVPMAEAPEAAEPAPVVPRRPYKPVRTAAAPVAEAPAPSAPMQQAMVSPSDAALGFKPSSAPPLDPTISQFVATPIVQRYQQTAADAGLYYSGPRNYAAESAPRPARHRRASAPPAVGGPENMTGSVVANLDVLGPAAAPAPAPVYADTQGTPAAAVIFFPGDTVNLNAAARAEIREAVDMFNAGGGQGTIRVIGHSSSRTPNMSVARHIAVVFRKSQERADAVARELIRQGIPADRVMVEAVGDSQPVYYESMPKGEEGNRRAEIYIQN